MKYNIFAFNFGQSNRMPSLLKGFSRKAIALAIAAPIVATLSLVAMGTSATPPLIPAVQLSTDPLYANTTSDKPAMALALSVEYPTVGAQYTPGGSTDNTYSNTTEYLGYYDAEGCYTYNNAPSETVAAGLSTIDYKRFDRTANATNRKCTNAFSGNFLNWASSSAIDMLRLALSGGDRYIDTTDLTILQRAVIPNGDPVCMWNTTNFPAKQLARNGGGTNAYWGAVPTALITQANGSDIWVANTLNRLYFGTSQAGTCGSTGAYTLGGPSNMESPIRTASALPGSGMTTCINGESGTCSFSGVKEVWYGANNKWFVAAANNGVDCSAGCNSVFGDPISGTAKKVYYRNYTGSWTPNSANALNSDGFFYARVQVCNINTSGTLQDSRDYGLCQQYPSGKYKPTGVIQKYSDQLRLAAFGYLMDPRASYNNGRYGGVLRAPMKYVGAKTYNENGQDNTPSGGNAKAEWNSTTGVLYANPENYTNNTAALNFGVSGVINYLNKFGRTGPVQGRYKTYDPVGELHYETLRYLQGLPPSNDAISGLDTPMYDGFPVYTAWDDPYGGTRSNTSDYSCLKSNIVMIGDINSHDGNRLPTPNTANNIIDINAWRTKVQNFEKNQTSQTYVDGAGVQRPIANPNGVNNSVPTGTQTSQIMGSAYWAHTHDIRGTDWTNQVAKQRPGLRVKTFLFDVNEYGAQNDANTRRYANQFFMASKYGGFESDPANTGGKPYNTQGNPFKDQNGVNNNNVWQKSAEPGEAGTYYLQSSARGVLNAFNDIFSRAATSARSIAGSSSSSSSVGATSATAAFSAKFDTSNWSGDVVSEPITINSGNASVGTANWSASDRLATMASPATNRDIFVGKVGSTANPKATEFVWSAIEPSMQAHLNKEFPTSTADTRGSDRLNFLRGDRTLEGNLFRVRSSILGDIVNSSVVYSGAPSTAYTGTGYKLFRNQYDNRTKAVFAGANDGMLHAFNAATGDELFAYIPSWMGPKLSALTSTTYANNHQNYVDAPPVVAEAQVGSGNSAAADWKTVLVSGTGGGGAGVFALDVSNPSAFDSSNVMWEFTHTDDVDMGYVVGQPQILKLRTNSSGTPTYRTFAVVASGVNNYVEAGGSASNYSSGNPTLFFLALDKAVGTSWAEGTNYYKVSLPFDATLAATKATGAINFSALWGNAGEVTHIYIGDLHGRLWKLRFEGVAASNWSMANLSAFKNTSGVPYPMFIAKTGDTVPVTQAITAAPALFTGPIVGGIQTYYVVVGTGKFLESADKTSSLRNSIYALFDDGTDSATGGDSAINGRARLKQGSVNTTAKTINVPSFIWGKATSNSDSANPRSGWYADFPDTGEKLVSNINDRGNLISAFNTIIPGSSSNAGACSSTTGSGNSYLINIASGAGTYVVSQVGLLGPDTYFTSDADTVIGAFNSAGQRTRTTKQKGVTFGQSGTASSGEVTLEEIIGRMSWRQINNYQDLKNTP